MDMCGVLSFSIEVYISGETHVRMVEFYKLLRDCSGILNIVLYFPCVKCTSPPLALIVYKCYLSVSEPHIHVTFIICCAF